MVLEKCQVQKTKGILEFLDSGRKSWTMGSGRWTLNSGRWTLDTTLPISQAATHESWLVRCSPRAVAFSHEQSA